MKLRHTLALLALALVAGLTGEGIRTALAQTSAGYERIQDEGVNLTRRSTINFVGTQVTCADTTSTGVTTCTISGATSCSTPTLLNSWVSYNTANGVSSFQEPSHCKNGAGEVFIRGLLASGTTTAGTVLFTLPIARRPASRLVFPCVAITTPGSTWANCRVDVEPDGDVLIVSGGNVALSLDGIRFYADGS